MNASEPYSGWPSKEMHDEVKKAYTDWLIKNNARIPNSHNCTAFNKEGRQFGLFGGSCAYVDAPARQSARQDYVRVMRTGANGEIPELFGRDHMVIRDKECGDHVLAWMNS